MIANFHLYDVETSGAWTAARRLAAATRALVQECATLDGTDDAHAAAIDAAAAELERIAATLQALPHKTALEGLADGSFGPHHAYFMDRIPMVGHSNPLSPPMRLTSQGAGDALVVQGAVTFAPQYGGAPGVVHGGFVAAAFDQLFGYLGVMSERAALTGSLTVRYRKPTPVGKPLAFAARVERVDGRKSLVRGSCAAVGSANDEITAEAEGLFVAIDNQWFAERLRG